MRKSLAFVLALCLLFVLAACAVPQEKEPATDEPTLPEATAEHAAPFDIAAYKAALSGWAEADPVTHVVNPAPHIADAFQPLKDYEGILPDEAVLAFSHFLDRASDGLPNYEAEKHPFLTLYGHSYFSDPDYPAVIKALEGKLSSGAALWLVLKMQAYGWEADIYEPDTDEGEMRLLIPFEHLLHLAKAWHTFELEYPEIAASEYAGYYGNNSAGWVDRCLDSGDDYGLSAEGKRLYAARQKAYMEEFLGNETNRKYTFYEDIYQFIHQ